MLNNLIIIVHNKTYKQHRIVKYNENYFWIGHASQYAGGYAFTRAFLFRNVGSAWRSVILVKVLAALQNGT